MRPLWIILILVLCVLAVDGEHPSHVRGQHSTDAHVINNREKAEELLQRYGYLRCNIGKKHRLKVKKKGVRHCSKAEVREAIRQYQRLFNMHQTGKLDKATMKMMSASRCGNRDDEIGLQSLEQQTTVTVGSHRKDRKNQRIIKGISRQKRALDAVKRVSFNEAHVTELISDDSTFRRKQWMQNQMRSMETDKPDVVRRRRRAVDNEESRDIFQHEVITWRLIGDGYSDQMTIKAQRSALALAFRMWSEVIPRNFYEDLQSPVDDVDILIAFGRGEHLNCLNNFDGLGGQLSHAVRQAAKAEIHVDDDEIFTLGSESGTNLLKVAVHEVGHVLGLIHTRKNYSIMYAIYSEMIPNRNFELCKEDRELVQSIYGVCDGRFNTVFDWVRKRHDGQLIFNTYFFRGDHYWLYENQFNRTRYGDPLDIASEWRGLTGPLDGFAHVWTSKQDVHLFFKGNKYWEYNSEEDQVSPGYPKLIAENFQGMKGTNHSGIPNNIDTVYFDKRDGNLYFFKNNLVYGYDVSKGDKGCCLPGYPKAIQREFPQLPSNLDVAYYSYTDRFLYFFKDRKYWIDIGYHRYERHKIHMIIGPFPVYNKWRDICDVQGNWTI